jgi:hypothetical protein
MTRTILTASPSEAANAANPRRRRLVEPIKVVIGLLAVYAPIVLVLALHRMPIAKAYFAVSIWAIEGILWYALDKARHPDRR